MLARTLLPMLVCCALFLPRTAAAQKTPPSVPAVHDSTDVDLLMFEGNLDLEEGKIEDAINVFARVVVLEPDRLEGHLLYAQALTRGLLGGLFQDMERTARTAVKNYQWVLDHDPGNREARAGIGLLRESFLRETPSPMKTDEGIAAWKEGEQALENGDNTAAAAAFRRATTVEPDVAAAHALLGESLRRGDHLMDAVRAFEKALELDPQDFGARIGLARAYESQKHEDRALEQYRQAFRLEPDHVPTATALVRLLEGRRDRSLKIKDQALLGECYLVVGRYDDAVTTLEPVLEKKPTLAVRKALGIAEFFLKHDDRAGKLLEACLNEDAHNLEVLYYLGALHLRQGDVKVGEKYLRDLLALDPTNPNGQRLLGLSLVEHDGDPEEAVRYLEGAHEAGARIDNFPCLMGSLYLRVGRTYQASQSFQSCLDENPDYPKAHLGLGLIADDQGQTREAIDQLERYLELAKEPDPAAIFRLGVAYLRSGQDKKGFTTLRRIVRSGGDADSTALSDTELLEATSYFLGTVRRFNDAIFIGELLLTKDPDNSIYNNNLAMAYADANQKPGRAYTLAVKANHLSPDNPGHMDTLGWALIRLDRLEEAEPVLKRCLKLARKQGQTNLSEIQYHLGVLYSRMKRHQDAVDVLTQAAASPPTPYLDREISSLLESEKELAGSQ